MELKIFSEFVNKMQSTNSRLEKEEYLKEYSSNPVVKVILHFLYNPYIVTGISKKKIKKFKNFVDLDLGDSTVDLVSMLNYLDVNNTGRDEILLTVESFLQTNSEYRDLLESIITKDLKLGVQSTTLNKIYGSEFIPTFDVMLGTKYFDDPDKYVPDGVSFIITQKLDGVRCVCINDYTGVKFFSRQGQPINDLIEIEEEVSRNLPKGIVYDGELLLRNDNNLESKDLYRATVKVTSSDDEKTNLIFNVFDMLSVDDFQNGFSSNSADIRKSKLHNYLSKRNLEFVKEVPILYQGDDKNKINYWLDKITSEGGEGIMLNISDSPYECKRSKKLLKVKKMQTADVLVLDVQEGDGQNSGKLGAILIRFIGPDGKEYECLCGSGFTLKEREDFWNDKDKIIGKIAEVQYFEISQNENGKYSFRFPVFKHIREDKSEISMN